MNVRKRLQRKVAIVTGGTSGIGKQIAVELFKEGATIVVTGRNEARGKEFVRDYGGKIDYVCSDVSKEESVKHLIDYVTGKYKTIHILINNAGIQYEETIENTSVEKWDEVLDINAKGVFLTSKYVIPYMRSQNDGSIINISSVDGFWAEPQLGAYCASKGAVLALTKSVALDFGKDNIRCNAICPAYIETEMLQQYFNIQVDPILAKREIADRHPLQRLGTPKDVAQIAKWLASGEADYITGQTFVVDGGLTTGHII